MAPMEARILEPDMIPRAETCFEPDLPTLLANGVALGETDVAIRAAPAARRVRCVSCGAAFVASGPTAYADDEPLCDVCVFEHDAQLAMVLAAVSVLRAFGSGEPSQDDAQAALDLLGFARLYETFADRYGPRREPQHPVGS